MPLYKSLTLLILLLVSSSSILTFKYTFLFLKCLLASWLILFKLSTLLQLGSCIHCILAYFLWSKKSTHSNYYKWQNSIYNILATALQDKDVFTGIQQIYQTQFRTITRLKFSSPKPLQYLAQHKSFLPLPTYQIQWSHLKVIFRKMQQIRPFKQKHFLQN